MIERLVTEFLEMMTAEKGASPNTVDAYRRDVEQFFEICPVKDVAAIGKKIFRAICGLCQMKKFMQPVQFAARFRQYASFLNFYTRKS